jgi:VWFA-related protein
MPASAVRRTSRPLVTAFAAVMAVSIAVAQAPQDPPVFRGGTTFVSVDVFPRRDGAVVEGLEAGDFEVLEDGVPQSVESFRFIRIDPNPADQERRDPNTAADSARQAANPDNRVFVVYLDTTHTTIGGSHYARQPVLDFLTRTIGSGDLFGVLTAEVPVHQLVFGRRTDTLADELARHWPWGQADRLTMLPRTPQEQRLVDCGAPSAILALWREDQLMTSLEHLTERLGSLKDERKNILFISEGWVPRGPARELDNVSLSEGAPPSIGVGPGGRIGIGGTMDPFRRDPATCDAEVRRLASIDFELRFRELLQSATRANVTFYPVDVGGLRTTRTRATDTLMTMADYTDGFAVVGTNDLDAGIRRISRDLSAFYLLGYYSTNGAANGRYRQIEVRVRQPGVRVSARRGYLAPTAAMLAAAASAGRPTTASAADVALSRLAALRDGSDAFLTASASPGELYVALELAPNQLSASTQASVRAVRSDGATIEGALDVSPGVRASSVVFPVASGPAPGSWQVTVQILAGDRRIDPRIEIPASVNRLIGQARGWRAASLSARATLVPLVDARMSRRERLHVQWPVLMPGARHDARLLDRTGRPLGTPLPVVPASDERPALSVDLPLAALPEGDYLLELRAVRETEEEREPLAFRVTR